MAIQDVLKPKSHEDVKDEINKMSTFEFCDKFLLYDVRRLKPGFKKLITHSFVSAKSKIRKKVSRIYYTLFFVWLVFDLFKIFVLPRTGMIFAEGPIDVFVDALWYPVMAFFPYYIFGFIVQIRFMRWKRKKRTHFHIPDEVLYMVMDVISREVEGGERIRQGERIRREEVGNNIARNAAAGTLYVEVMNQINQAFGEENDDDQEETQEEK